MIIWIGSNTKAAAQKDGFYMVPQAGLLNGDKKVDASVQLSGGVSCKQWQYGAGMGFDYYKFRSVPLYAEGKRFFGSKDNKPFLYAEAGWNIAYPLENQRYHNYGWWTETTMKSKFSNGIIAGGGAGVFLPNKKGNGVMLALGYSTKTLRESWTEFLWDPVAAMQVTSRRSQKYILNRVVLKIGFRVF